MRSVPVVPAGALLRDPPPARGRRFGVVLHARDHERDLGSSHSYAQHSAIYSTKKAARARPLNYIAQGCLAVGPPCARHDPTIRCLGLEFHVHAHVDHWGYQAAAGGCCLG